MITVSKQATEKFEEIRLKVKNPENSMIRVSFGGYGWGGPKLQLTLEELKNENDVVVESRGVKVVYTAKLEAYLRDSVIDYSNKWFDRGFSIKGSGTSSC